MRQRAEIAAELVKLKVDVVVTWGTASTIAAKQATSVIPVVTAAMGAPLGTGIVASLARGRISPIRCRAQKAERRMGCPGCDPNAYG
jgi:ABC-type uncharacterized transport system substrate-binding protein